eukprot:309759_1
MSTNTYQTIYQRDDDNDTSSSYEEFMDSDDEQQSRRLQELEYKIGHRPSTEELIEKNILYKKTSEHIYIHSKWTKLASFDEYKEYSNPVCINNNEYIILPTNNRVYHETDPFHKYNILKNEWSEWIEGKELDKLFNFYADRHTLTMDRQNNKLYAYYAGDLHQLSIFDLNTGKSYHYNSYLGDYNNAIIINGEYNVFGEEFCSQHLTWNKHEKKFNVTNEFNYDELHCHCAIIYIHSLNAVLLIGGERHQYDDISNDYYSNIFKSIYLYSFNSNKLTKIESIELPQEIRNFGYVITEN